MLRVPFARAADQGSRQGRRHQAATELEGEDAPEWLARHSTSVHVRPWPKTPQVTSRFVLKRPT